MLENHSTPNRLYRSRSNRVLAGVAGGIGEYLNIDPVLVRLGFVLLALTPAAGPLIYIVLAIIMPTRPEGESEPSISRPMDATRDRQLIGLVLAGIGVILLIGNLGLFAFLPWAIFSWHNMWPLIIIGIGVVLLTRTQTHRLD
ncbi:MAG: PspC domain-containing protein [Dehalococcoidales bacterium]|nr:PspC domain-containing protein [Dehalococcoidales bacterium]